MNNATIMIPEPLVKLENHLQQPPIITNINKKKNDIVKKIQDLKVKTPSKDLDQDMLNDQSPPDGASEKLTTRKQLQAMVSRLEKDTKELQHNYAEGTDFTLTDLVIFPCVVHILVNIPLYKE